MVDPLGRSGQVSASGQNLGDRIGEGIDIGVADLDAQGHEASAGDVPPAVEEVQEEQLAPTIISLGQVRG